MADDDYDEFNEIKLVLLGESGVGKTSLINASIGKDFKESVRTTVSCSFVRKEYEKGKNIYTLNIWDTVGQEQYRAINKIFIKNTKIVIFTYCINRLDSFQALTYWVSIVKDTLGDEPILGLIGNKSDLYAEAVVDQKTAMKYAEQIGAKFQIVSAKNNTEAFNEFLEILLDEYLAKNGLKTEEEEEKKEKEKEIKEIKEKKGKKVKMKKEKHEKKGKRRKFC